MKKAERFYRNHYPKVKELTVIDKEIIKLLELYKETDTQALTLGSVSCSFKDRINTDLEELNKRLVKFYEENSYTDNRNPTFAKTENLIKKKIEALTEALNYC